MKAYPRADIGTMLDCMEQEARARHAPIFALENLKTTPFRALLFTMLSARTKDSTTIPIAKRLFQKAHRPEGMLRIPLSTLEKMLYGIGFYRVKARHLHGICQLLLSRFKGRVPDTLDELITLPGVGRKTANIVLNVAFGKPVIGVDTHVHRISNRLGLIRTRNPGQTEAALNRIVPERHKIRFNKILVAYGQTVCTPISPWCSQCPLRGHYCPRIGIIRSR